LRSVIQAVIDTDGSDGYIRMACYHERDRRI
jgi:hypothetical protein